MIIGLMNHFKENFKNSHKSIKRGQLFYIIYKMKKFLSNFMKLVLVNQQYDNTAIL